MPGPLTVTLVHDVPRRAGAPPELLSASRWPSCARRLEECRRLTDALAPGVDFTREIALTRDLGIGDTTLVRESGELVAFALWHSTPLAAGRAKDEVRVLKLVARLAVARSSACSRRCTARRRRSGSADWRSAARPSTPTPTCGSIAAGYRVHWTDLRMILRGFPPPPRQGIVLSNWEI